MNSVCINEIIVTFFCDAKVVKNEELGMWNEELSLFFNKKSTSMANNSLLLTPNS